MRLCCANSGAMQCRIVSCTTQDTACCLFALRHARDALPPPLCRSPCIVRAQAKLAQADSGAQRTPAVAPPRDLAGGARQAAGAEAVYGQLPRPAQDARERPAPLAGRDAAGHVKARAAAGATKERKSGGAAAAAPARVKDEPKPGMERGGQERGGPRSDREAPRAAPRKPSHPKPKAHAGAKRPALNAGGVGAGAAAAPAAKRARQAVFSSSSGSERSLCGEPPAVRSGSGAGGAGAAISTLHLGQMKPCIHDAVARAWRCLECAVVRHAGPVACCTSIPCSACTRQQSMREEVEALEECCDDDGHAKRSGALWRPLSSQPERHSCTPRPFL